MILGHTTDMVAKLRSYAVVLPTHMQISANAVSAEVLAVIISNLSLDRACSLVWTRDRVHFCNIDNTANQLCGIVPGTDTVAATNLPGAQIHYSLVYEMARHKWARVREVALVPHSDPVNSNTTRTAWACRIDKTLSWR